MADFTISVPDALVGVQPQDSNPPPAQQQQPQEPVADEEWMEIDVGGMIIEAPKNATPDQIKVIVRQAIAQPEFDALIDKKTGASFKAAAMTGSRTDTVSKLETLRTYYPDATPYGEDNYVFTNPATGRPTLYNPPGLEARDVASVTADIWTGISSVTGATVGAAVGAAAGTPAGPPGMIGAGTKGGIWGAGLGAAFGRASFDAIAEAAGLVVDRRSLVQKLADIATEGAFGAVGQGVGNVIEKGINASKGVILGAGNAKTQNLFKQYESFGIDPDAGMVTGGKGTIAKLEALTEQAPAGATIFADNAEKVMGQTVAAIDTMAKKYGTGAAVTKEQIGGIAKEAAVGAKVRMLGDGEGGMVRGYFGEKYDEIDNMLGLGTPIPSISAIEELASKMALAVSSTPKLAENPAYKGALGLLHDIIYDFDRGMNVEGMRAWRTTIGQKLDGAAAFGNDISTGNLKRIYGALRQDLTSAAEGIDPAAANLLKETDAQYKAWMDDAGDTISRIIDTNADEEIYKAVFGAAQDGGTRLRALRANFTDEQWGNLAGSYLKRMGLSTASAQNAAGDAFSPSTFMTQWSKTSKQAKDELFGGAGTELRDELDNLASVIESMRNLRGAAGQGSAPNLAAANMIMNSFTALGAMGSYMATGDVMAAGKTALALGGGVIAAPIASAKLLTHPKFVKWLAEPASPIFGEVGQHIGKLYALGEASPEIKEEIDQYIGALRHVSSYNAPDEGGNQK